MLPNGIVLDASDKKLEILLAAAGTIPVTVNFIDLLPQSKSDFSAYRPGQKLSTTSGTTPVTICEAPAQGTVRIVNYICVHDSDAGAETLTIQIDSAGTDYIQVQIALAATESAVWTPESGWNVIT